MNIKFTKEYPEPRLEDWTQLSDMKPGFHINEKTGGILFKEDVPTVGHRSVVVNKDGTLTLGPTAVVNFKHVDIIEIKYKEIK